MIERLEIDHLVTQRSLGRVAPPAELAMEIAADVREALGDGERVGRYVAGTASLTALPYATIDRIRDDGELRRSLQRLATAEDPQELLDALDRHLRRSASLAARDISGVTLTKLQKAFSAVSVDGETDGDGRQDRR